MKSHIQIISAPSILGLKPSGVEYMGSRLIECGLSHALKTNNDVVYLEDLNAQYSGVRDPKTDVLNPLSIRDFSLNLGAFISASLDKKQFPFVLGGDCSILIGIMAALKGRGDYGLVFLDAHADFYEPEKSVSGEVADMDLAIVTGRGPKLLTDINGLQPYVEDSNVIHIGQRDWEETQRYRSQDIRKTSIKVFGLDKIRAGGIIEITDQALEYLDEKEIKNFWLHFDTDVIADELNPAVDYRIEGGLRFDEVEHLVHNLRGTGGMTGVSITIYNPLLDAAGHVAKDIVKSLGRAFDPEQSGGG